MNDLPINWTTFDGNTSVKASYPKEEITPSKDIPAIYITMLADDLFSKEKGIYSNPQQKDKEWERTCQISFTNLKKNRSFSRTAGIRIHGCTSRDPNRTKKHSFALKFKNKYGGELDYPLFGSDGASSFHTLILDATSNITWTDSIGSQNARAQYIRNQYCSDLQELMGWKSLHCQYVNLYLNGMYWGVYGLREKPDEFWCKSYLGGKLSDYEVIKNTCISLEVKNGDINNWNTLINSIKDYNQAKKYLNIDQFIDYILLNTFVGNTDWSMQNWYAVRNRRLKTSSLWQFISWDAEFTLLKVNENVSGKNESNSPTGIHSMLCNSMEYKNRFAARAKMHFDKVLLKPEIPYLKRAAEIESSIELEAKRWGDIVQPNNPYTKDNWLTELNWLKNEYFIKRGEVVKSQLKTRLLYLNI